MRIRSSRIAAMGLGLSVLVGLPASGPGAGAAGTAFASSPPGGAGEPASPGPATSDSRPARSDSASSEIATIPAPPADRVLRRQSEALLDDPAALLRAAAEAIAQGDEAHADWLYGELAQRHPIVGDHATLSRARLRLSKGLATEAERLAGQALRDFPDSPLRAELHEVVGRARIAERDEVGGRGALSAALSETRDDELRAALLREIARSEERSGEDRAAGVTWRLLWYAHPESAEAEQASHRLDVIETHLGEALRRPSDWRRRGDRFFGSRMNEEALAAYDEALARGLSAPEARRARKQRAHTLFRLRRYPEALAAFEALPQTDDIPIWRARSLARANRVPEAIAALEQIAREGGPHAARAHYLAALLLDGRDRSDEARRHFTVLAEDRGQGSLRDAALWWLGWSDYRRGEMGRAVARFEELEAATRDDIDRLRPLYWRARALEHLDAARAQAAFAELAAEFPLSYYGWRASERIGNREQTPRRSTEVAPGRSVLRPAELARARILMEAGLVDAAAEEGRELARRARGLDDRIALARLLTSAGDFNRAQRLVVDAYTTPLARGPRPGLEELWWYAWPSAFSDHVDQVTRESDVVGPELVYSIMREESGYRPRVISPVGARGLLQIMRETGARLASRRGRPSFDPDELFDPRTNIELGAFYLDELAQRFPTRLSASIASYNAGPHVVADWVSETPRPDDEWVESIPYSQTRSYVKRVMRSLQAYRLLY